MTSSPESRVLSLPHEGTPSIAETAWTAPGAVIVGNVVLHDESSVWYNSVLRSESETIELGEGSNIQDNCSLHVDVGFPLTIGRGVSVGHGAVLHGCTIGDDVLVGMGATVLNGAVIGAGSLIAAGTVLLEGTVVPPGSLVAGVPGRVKRELGDGELAGIRRNAATYRTLAALHAQA
ncbi:gamma carbonic anhydrase family protein [Compostimonas suwonensis]|uniref:Carbonic anhydrase/acetyltransferase-like protein (Isoleucine patch superfamily) n=1 Tax=Compostimonas suwonensis TaxID=1048394 RepID=A0A2M9BVD7_9MICO|nr:gamma carbonic anhydrase family protein [Compostimonas suwonensis]PJJ61916.1 carbonic anhydrase/acetyltransferase-like protein (isoleucine patch superfamily) [Compostimonas suwonensis]